MSIRKTVELIEIPYRDRYGKETGDIAEVHVATTIVHNVVHLSLEVFASGKPAEQVEANMTDDEARALIHALIAAIGDNERHVSDEPVATNPDIMDRLWDALFDSANAEASDLLIEARSNIEWLRRLALEMRTAGTAVSRMFRDMHGDHGNDCERCRSMVDWWQVAEPWVNDESFLTQP